VPTVEQLESAARDVAGAWCTTYRANPVTVQAHHINGVGPKDAEGNTPLMLANGEQVTATPEMTARYTPEPGDMWVIQEDGYIYINPRAVFERKYSPAYESLSFGDAIYLLRRGARVARRGWNGRDMWLSYSPGTPGLPADKFWSPHNRDFAIANGGRADVLPCITMRTADGKILMGWLASQTDMLACDWVVVP